MLLPDGNLTLLGVSFLRQSLSSLQTHSVNIWLAFVFTFYGNLIKYSLN